MNRRDEKSQTQLFTHLQNLIEHYDKLWNIRTPSPIVAGVLEKIGICYVCAGKPRIAKFYHERALKILETHYGKDHWTVSIVLNNLGNLLRDSGAPKLAQDLHERALEIDESHYGKEHKQVARTLNNLGLTLLALGEFKDAERLLRRGLKIEEGFYGKEHFEVARNLNNLGNVLCRLGNHPEAKELYARVLKIKENHYGKNHWQVASALNNLSLVHRDLGEIGESKKSLVRALKIFRQHFPENHPFIQVTLQNLRKSFALEQQFLAAVANQDKQKSSSHLPIFQFHTGGKKLTISESETLTFYRAVEGDKEEIVKQLLGNLQALDINAIDPQSGRTALHIAVIHRRTSIVGLLVQAGAQQDISDKQGKTAATYALESGDQEIIAILQSRKSSSRPKT